LTGILVTHEHTDHVAGLAAKGTTEIGEIHYIERGYDDLVGKLRGVGADITIIACPDDEVSNAAG
jgi:UDP-N-acetylglucosamine 1-carboxyvinyltransferase